MIQATGPQANALQQLARMLASTNAFRNRRGEFSVAEALESVYYPYVDDPDQTKRPYCVCMTAGGLGIEKGARETFRNTGTIELCIADDADLFENIRESKIDFLNFVDGIIQELVEFSDEDGGVNIISVKETMEPIVSDPRNVTTEGHAQRPYWIAKYAVEWENYSL